jgi:hypothetical protein
MLFARLEKPMIGNTLRPKSGEGDASWQQVRSILAKRGSSFAAALPS